jgi:hypothetical protein
MAVEEFQKTKHAADAIEERVAWYTVGIVTGSGERKRQGIGTGAAVRWRGQHYILTAEHVLRETDPQDLRFFFRPDNTLRREEREEVMARPGVPTRWLLPPADLQVAAPIVDADLDLAVIPVRSDLQKSRPVLFFEIDAGRASPAENTTVITTGFPFDITRLTFKDERVAFTSVVWTEVVPPLDGLDRKYDPNRHFLTPFDVDPPTADPAGFSGAGVWYRKGDTPGIWHPNLDLAGVVIGYYRRSRVLQIVRREAVEGFLSVQFG